MSGNAVRIRDVATGEETQRFEGHRDYVAFSPDAKMIAFVVYSSIELWDTETGKEMKKLEGHTLRVDIVGFSPDNKTVASTSCDKTIRLWDVATGDEMKRLEVHTFLVCSVAFSPNTSSNILASGSEDGTVRLWDISSSEEPAKLEGHGEVTVVAFSPDNKIVASGWEDGSIGLWDVATGEAIQPKLGKSLEEKKALALSHDNKRLAAVTYYGVELWDVTTGEIIHRKITAHIIGITTLAYSIDREKLAVAGSGLPSGKTVEIWDVETLQTTRSIELGPDKWSPDALAFSLDGGSIAVSFLLDSVHPNEMAQIIQLWDVTTEKEWQRFEINAGAVPSVQQMCFTPDGEAIDTNVGRFSLITKAPLGLVTPSAARFTGLTYSPWIQKNGADFLWLPREYCGKLANTIDSVLAIGHESGGVTILSFREASTRGP